MAIIGYARVSSKEQNLDRQIDALVKAGAEKIFTDKLSGKNTDRPELKKAIAYIRDNDIFLVSSLDRLGRSLTDLINLVQEITDKKAEFKSLKENIENLSESF